MHDAQHSATYWCLDSIEPWMHSIWLLIHDAMMLSHNAWSTALSHVDALVSQQWISYWASIEPLRHNNWAILMPPAQHWAIILMLNALLHWAKQFTCTCTTKLGVHNTIVNSVHTWAAQYGVDGGQQKLKSLLYYLKKEGVLVLIACLESV